jgi:hypothetical protein
MADTAEGRRRTATRALAALGAAAGLAMALRPERIVDRVCPEFPRSRLWLIRVLGGRLLLQHGAVLVAPEPELVRLGSSVDLLHAASMLPFARSPRYGRAAGISGALAAAYAVLARVIARTAG